MLRAPDWSSPRWRAAELRASEGQQVSISDFRLHEIRFPSGFLMYDFTHLRKQEPCSITNQNSIRKSQIM